MDLLVFMVDIGRLSPDRQKVLAAGRDDGRNSST
jgi:hypothetical protein